MGEENIIDSIPLAEADLVTVSDEDGSQNVQYAKNNDLVSSLGRKDSFPSQPAPSEVTSTQTHAFAAGLKRIHSTKFFSHPSKIAHNKSEEDPAKTKLSLLQISTISEGFNSGLNQLFKILP